MDQTIIIATFDDRAEGQQAAETLREAGIEVDIDQQEAVGTEAAPATESGRFGLAVTVGNAERAREMLDDTYDESLADGEGAGPDDEDPFSDTSPQEEEEWEEMTEGMRCPNCGGKQLGLGSPLFQAVGTAVIISFVAVFLLPVGYRQYGMAIWGLILLAFLIGISLRRFPLICKECGYVGQRREFDPTAD